LFEYYPTKPAQLARWHPGVGVLLEGNPPHAGWRDYGFHVKAAVQRKSIVANLMISLMMAGIAYVLYLAF